MPALFRVRVFGRENVPRRGGALIASSHQSYLDPALVAVGLKRPVSFMARSDLFGAPLFGALIRSLGAFPVERGGADVGAFREAVRRLQHGSLLLVFPEGTRTPDGSIRPLKEGLPALAVRAGVPIVPAVIDGAFELWPRSRALFTLGRVWVAFGRPLAAPTTTGTDRGFLIQQIRSRMGDLQRFLRQVRAARPAAAVSGPKTGGLRSNG
jgi:1-acyl-sn-glycerol-3-phosphate acyltransferase